MTGHKAEPETVEQAREKLFVLARYVDRAGGRFTVLVDGLEAAVRRDERERVLAPGPLCTACGKSESFWEHMFRNGHPFEPAHPVSASGGAE